MPSRTHAVSRHLGRHQDALMLGSFVLVHLVTTLLWLREDQLDMNRVPDEFSHYWGLVNLHAALSLDLLEGALNGLRVIHSNYPLIVHFPRVAAGLLFGPSPLVFCAANVVYGAALLVSVYYLGRRCHGRSAGLLAAALVSVTPAFYGGARSMGLDYPAMCMTSLAVLMLVRADGFRRLPDAIGFGVCAGLAILIKGQSALFLVWPAAFVLGRAVWRVRAGGEALWRPLAGGALAVAVLLGTTAVWWAGRVAHLARYMSAHSTGEGLRDVAGDITLWGGVVHYTQALPLVLSAPLALAALLLLPAFVRRGKQRWVVLIWLVVPLALHMALSVRHPRYIFPLVPAAAVILAVGLCSLRPRLRSVAAAVVGGLGVIAWLSCTCLSHPAPMRPRPFKCYKEWPMPESQRRSELAAKLLSCGSCEYAGAPSAPVGAEHQQLVTRLVRTLEAQNPKGEEMLVYSDEVHRFAQTAVMVQPALTSTLFMDVQLAGELLPHTPSHRRRTFLLWRANRQPPPVPGLVRLTQKYLQLMYAPNEYLELHLYSVDPTTRWPHPGETE